jgi:GDP-L-fucose synthase
MKNAIETQADEVKLWGDGSITREFFFVEDAAKSLVLAAERYDRAEPLNLGNGSEVSIKDLAMRIGAYMGYKGRFVWDSTQPQGQLRRCLDVTAAEKLLGFKADTNLDQGLKKTIQWYNQRSMHVSEKIRPL